MPDIKNNRVLDLRGFICPLNVVKAKQEIKGLNNGDQLTILLESGDPLERVLRALKDDGHKIITASRNDDDSFAVQVEKKSAGAKQ